ncbi:hypothetical protein SCHPADRAFT_828858 [Schizopora paradoxa]|uniref:Golgi apparatus membrane protein TVP38 n=1 Tax=Schizopora paradoxa TaxID=27342 RepID=A0A0H2RTP2_9AGAM|nr:hypothetical protein SCHPADRAFT_828858 [Schizopora paradoxa]
MSSAHSAPPSKWLLRERLRPWIPYILYGATSLAFVLAITFWKDDVFRNLDELSHWLRDEGESGYLLLGAMIFVTCIPPLPLYSTLQVLSGYTFGAWVGGIVSYVSALLGALFVFGVSRLYFRRTITRCLSHTKSFRRVVRAIARRPSLLFLVRLAPYPYNMLNALLAGAPTLTFRTYASCTALSLFKVWIHTTIGASIHSFAAYHVHKPKAGEDDPDSAPELKNGDDDSDFLSQATTIGGLVLCIAIAVYLSFVARRAVNEELDDDADDNMEEMEEGNATRARPPTIIERLHARERERERARERRLGNDEETAAFLSSNGEGSSSSQSLDSEEQEMSERNIIRLASPAPRS